MNQQMVLAHWHVSFILVGMRLVKTTFIFRIDLQQVDRHSCNIKSSSHGQWFPFLPLFFHSPFKTLLSISGTSDLEKDMLVIKEKMQDST